MLNPEEESQNTNTSEEKKAAASPEKEEVKPKAEKKTAKKEKVSAAPTDRKAPPKEVGKSADSAGKKGKAAPKEGKAEAKKAKSKADKGKSEKPKAASRVPKDYIPRQLKNYRESVAAELTQRFNYKNPMMIPQLQKIILNVGIGEGAQNSKLLEAASHELAAITGQKPVITRAKKSISNFKLRQGMPVGCRVTLRGWRMWEFLDRIMNVTIPRIRDFRGFSDRSFDGRGNYSVGIKEQIAFPEIDIDKIERVHGMDITFVTSAKSDEEAHALLEVFGWPFRRRATQSAEQPA